MQLSVFERFREIIYRESGIVLPVEKLPLLQNRIQSRLKALSINNPSEYLNIIELDTEGAELINLIDAISTNVTYFYREAAHFNFLRKILEEIDNKDSEIKIWCAAASSGEEPYTILFETLEALTAKSAKFRILATDICTKVLKKAVDGVYTDKAADSIPDHVKTKYMQEIAGSSSSYWAVNQEIRKHLVFKKLNLINFPYPLKGPIDIIFCRNVMIYFDTPTRQKIINQFIRLLPIGGYLILSHSENLLGIEHNLEKLGASVFRKTE